MEKAQDKPMPKWRNIAAWSAAGAVFYVLVVSAVSWLLVEDGIGAMLRSKEVAAILGVALIWATAFVGFSGRKRPFDFRNVRNFVIRDAVAVIVFLFAIWGFSALAREGALGAAGSSEWVAAVIGAVLVVVALLGALATASAHTGADLIDDEGAAEDMRERGRLFLYSFVWMAGCGLLLIVFGLAEPGGLLPPAAVLGGALVLIALLTLLGIAVWRLSDELARTLSNEAGAIAFYLILVIGGGWAMLAHLGYVAGPTPIDWLTMLTVLMFAASFIAVGRRKLLTR